MIMGAVTAARAAAAADTVTRAAAAADTVTRAAAAADKSKAAGKSGSKREDKAAGRGAVALIEEAKGRQGG